MSHAMLLRLFLSPFFSISVAMHYLKTYPDSIGISHYLCWRMKSMKTDEVEFYWPQICHLLITRPTQSNALECFVLERAEESTHSAMLTFWFMQAALRSLSLQRTANPRPFLICQRILHRCHEIIFGDPPEPSLSPYSLPPSAQASTVSLSRAASAANKLRASMGLPEKEKRKNMEKVNAHVPPALVGMGVILAAQGMPALEGLTGQVAVMQGRRARDEEKAGRGRVEVRKGAEGPRAEERGLGGPRESVDQGEEDSDSDDGEGRNSSVVGLGMGLARRSGLLSAVVDGGSGVAGNGRDKPLPPLSNGKGKDFEGAVRLDSPPLGNNASPKRKPPPPGLTNANGFSPVKSQLRRVSHPAHTSPSLIESSSPLLPTTSPSPVNPSSTFSSPQPQPRRSSAANDPLGQVDFSASPSKRLPHTPVSAVPRGLNRSPSHPRSNGGPSHTPFYSVPSLSLTSSDNGHSSFPSGEQLLAMYSPEAQRRLLRGHYCRSEVRFLLTLEEIADRLLVVPKMARVSALRAELTVLNHNLPAEVCMPMWCSADHSHEEGGETTLGQTLNARLDKPAQQSSRGHHRVVRISPGDSVVLNSAERAPYLLHVEVLENDLDFDPSKRGNRELLKKIVVNEERKKRKREGIDDYANGTTHHPGTFGGPLPGPPTSSTGMFEPEGSELGSPPLESLRRNPAQPSSQVRKPSIRVEELEEMDLVEQLFGSKFSVRDQPTDLAESLPLPMGPKNKQLDAMTWSKRDGPTSPALSRTHSTNASPALGAEASPKFPSTPIAHETVPMSPTSPVFDMGPRSSRPVITLEDYSERMRTAAVMLAQLNASLMPEKPAGPDAQGGAGGRSWIPGTGWIMGSGAPAAGESSASPVVPAPSSRLKLQPAETAAIRERIMEEMMALEEERVQRMTEQPEGMTVQPSASDGKTKEDEGIIRRELNKADPSAAVFQESWAAKKSRIRAASPWGHLAAWNVLSVIVKTGTDLRQEQLATQLIERFSKIWKEEKCDCWVRFFRILITGESSGLVETITDAVSVHSIKKSEYARRLADGNLEHVSLMDHYLRTYGSSDSGRFARAQRNFIKSLAGYAVVTYILQIKDRHNGNILVDRDGHLIHIDFGFMLSNSPGGNMGFEAAPFKMPMDYVEILGGLDGPGFQHFKKLFKEGFEAARKHSDSILTIVELMQKDSNLDCFQMFGDATSQHLRDRFQLGLTQAAVDAYLERLIVTSIGSSWTRLYDSFQYYSQGVL